MLVPAIALVYVVLFATFLGNQVYLRRTSSLGVSERAGDGAGLPRMSVLVPARNEEANLQRLLPSLIRQDYPELQIVIVDDDSTDDTWSVISSFADADPRIVPVRGAGPPPGWAGKVHALLVATQSADGEQFLFLDADTELLHPHALRDIIRRRLRLPDDAVLTGITSLRGGGKLLVSLVPHAMLVAIPWFLVRNGPSFLGGLNGQCWLISAEQYRRLDPHRENRGEVLEDVMIGRYLSRLGLVPTLADLQQDVAVHMYGSFGEAWAGFRKNSYLVMGGSVVSFLLTFVLFFSVYIVGPMASWPLLAAFFALKILTDARTGFPLWVSASAPLSFLAAVALQIDSAFTHWRGKVSWKQRQVSARM